MSSTRKTESSASKVGGTVRGIQDVIPAGVPPVLRNLWRFTKKNSREFAKHLIDPEKRDHEFTNAVVKKFKA